MKQFYMVMGEFSFVGICEAPDDVVVARYGRPKGAQINRPHHRGRGRDCRLPKAYLLPSTIAFTLCSQRSRI